MKLNECPIQIIGYMAACCQFYEDQGNANLPVSEARLDLSLHRLLPTNKLQSLTLAHILVGEITITLAVADLRR